MSSFHRTFVSYSSIVPFAVSMSSSMELAFPAQSVFPSLRVVAFFDHHSDQFSLVLTVGLDKTSVLHIV